MQKEVSILSRPSKLQPVADYSIITQCTHREKDQDLPQLLSTPGAQEMYQCTHKELYFLPEPSEKKVYPYGLTKQTLVQHRQNASWEPATVMSQCNFNSYWIMQENGTDQPKVYRRTRTMLKIRYTNVRQTRHNYSQSTESEKAKFQTPATSNAARNCVKHNSVENVSPDKITYFCFCFSYFRITRKGGNCRNCRCTCTCSYTCTCTGESQGTVPHSRIQKVNEKEPWKASQFIW